MLTSPTVMTLLYSRLTVLDVNGMMRTWTMKSALSQLGAFMEGPIVRTVSPEDIQRFVVTTEQRRTDRQPILASIAPDVEAPGDTSSPVVAEEEEMEVSNGEECQSPPADQEPAFPPSLLSNPVLAGSDNSSSIQVRTSFSSNFWRAFEHFLGDRIVYQFYNFRIRHQRTRSGRDNLGSRYQVMLSQLSVQNVEKCLLRK